MQYSELRLIKYFNICSKALAYRQYNSYSYCRFRHKSNRSKKSCLYYRVLMAHVRSTKYNRRSGNVLATFNQWKQKRKTVWGFFFSKEKEIKAKQIDLSFRERFSRIWKRCRSRMGGNECNILQIQDYRQRMNYYKQGWGGCWHCWS